MIFPQQILYATILLLAKLDMAFAQASSNVTQTDAVISSDATTYSGTGTVVQPLSSTRAAASSITTTMSAPTSQLPSSSAQFLSSSLPAVTSIPNTSQYTSQRNAAPSSANILSSISTATTPHSSSSSSSSTLIDVSLLTTYIVVGSSTSPTIVPKTVVKIGTVTGSSVAEVTAALNAASQENTGSGLSTQNKKIIIGVVAGVAGLVVLAALSTLLFRFVGKRSMSDDYARTRSDPFVADTYDPYGSHYHQQLNSKSRTKIDEISKNF